jgi:uncharacterized protein involved in outer membrane biogenesis
VAARIGILGRALRLLAAGIGGLLAVVLLVLTAFAVLEIPLDVSFLQRTVERVATDELGRDVRIDGTISLVPALAPTVQVEGFRIAGVVNSEPDLLSVDLARVRIAIASLLAGRIEILTASAEGVDLNLAVSQDGRANWLLGPLRSEVEGVADAPELPSEPPWQFAALGEVSVRQATLSYLDRATGEDYRVALDEIGGSLPDRDPLELRARGAVQDAPFVLVVEGGSLEALIAQDEPWPLSLSADVAGASIEIGGTAAEPLRGKGIDLTFSLEGEGLGELEKIVGVPLPKIGSYGFKGHLVEKDGAYRVSDLTGATTILKLAGGFTVDLSREHPYLSGELSMPWIDAGSWVEAFGRPSPGESGGEGLDQPATLDLDRPVWLPTALASFDSDVQLIVDEVIGAVGHIRDASLELRAREGILTAPVSLTFAEVPLSGQLELGSEQGHLLLEVDLDATGQDIGALAEALSGVKGVEGSFEKGHFVLSGRGRTDRELVETLELWFGINNAVLSYGHETDGEPVDVTLELASAHLPPGQRMQVSAGGTLLGEPFQIDFVGGGMAEFVRDEPWPIVLSASGGGARLRLEGSVAEAREAKPSEFQLELAGDKLGELNRWLPVASDANVPYAVRASISVAEREWRIPKVRAQIGKTKVSGQLIADYDGEAPFSLTLNAETVDVPGLIAALSSPDADPKAPAFTIDVPILPERVSLEDADVEVSIRRIRVSPSDVTDLTFSSRIRDGLVAPSPFEATVGDTRFSGKLALDLRGSTPQAEFTVASNEADVGALLADLGVAKDLELSAGRLAVDLVVEGSSVREILERSTLTGELQDARWTLRDSKTRQDVDIVVPNGRLVAAPGKPTTLSLDGKLDQTPVKIELKTTSLKAFVDATEEVTLEVLAEAGDAKLDMSGQTTKPLTLANFQASVALTGERLDSLDPLLDVALPPIGPYELLGKFGGNPAGYYVNELDVRVGGSQLTGELDLDTTGDKPRLVVDLVANTVQLDDFGIRDWSPLKGPDEEGVARDEEAAEVVDPDSTDPIAALLSPSVMRSHDVRLNLHVERFASGEDTLGEMNLKASLTDGRLSISPLQIDTPGGGVDVSFTYEPTEEEVRVQAQAKIDKLDYGMLARRVNPETDFGGLLSVEVDVRANAETPGTLSHHLDGHVGVAVWPENLEEDVFDLWASNLLLDALPKLEPEPDAQFNCIVARFTAQDGLLKSENLFMDSTRMQTFGNGTVDLETEKLQFVLAPRAKQPKLFSVATPAYVSGTFDDFDYKVGATDAMLTVMRLYYTALVFVFESTFGGEIPADGKVACEEAWAWDPPDSPPNASPLSSDYETN